MEWKNSLECEQSHVVILEYLLDSIASAEGKEKQRRMVWIHHFKNSNLVHSLLSLGSKWDTYMAHEALKIAATLKISPDTQKQFKPKYCKQNLQFAAFEIIFKPLGMYTDVNMWYQILSCNEESSTMRISSLLQRLWPALPLIPNDVMFFKKIIRVMEEGSINSQVLAFNLFCWVLQNRNAEIPHQNLNLVLLIFKESLKNNKLNQSMVFLMNHFAPRFTQKSQRKQFQSLLLRILKSQVNPESRTRAAYLLRNYSNPIKHIFPALFELLIITRDYFQISKVLMESPKKKVFRSLFIALKKHKLDIVAMECVCHCIDVMINPSLTEEEVDKMISILELTIHIDLIRLICLTFWKLSKTTNFNTQSSKYFSFSEKLKVFKQKEVVLVLGYSTQDLCHLFLEPKDEDSFNFRAMVLESLTFTKSSNLPLIFPKLLQLNNCWHVETRRASLNLLKKIIPIMDITPFLTPLMNEIVETLSIHEDAIIKELAVDMLRYLVNNFNEIPLISKCIPYFLQTKSKNSKHLSKLLVKNNVSTKLLHHLRTIL